MHRFLIPFRAWLRESDVWTRLALGVWTVILIAVCVRSAVQPTSHNLYPTFARAGAEWLTRGVVYHDRWEAPYDQYRYSPLITALLVPLGILPGWLGNVLWRLLNAGVFLGGLAWWLRAAAPSLPGGLTVRRQAVVFLLVAPLALSSLNNGQPNPLVIGFLLAAVAACARRRWMLAALCVGLSCALKVYPLAVGLLLVVLFPRRLGLPLLLALVVLALLPFVLQQPDYVADQYVHWFGRLGHNDRKYWPLEAAYRDLWLLFRVAHVPITPRVYLVIQLGSAASCAVLCAAARLCRLPLGEQSLLALALGTCWMMLCGPATESSTYVMLAPALAWAVVSASQSVWPTVLRLLPRAALALLLAGVAAGLFPRTGRLHALGMQPLAALLLSLSYLATFVRLLIRPHVATAPTLTRRAA